jgi:catechol 2,3-dioxygenase-like lactoylglutathione lyase family enzyme
MAVQEDRRQNKPETLRLRSLEPSFTVSDLDRSVRFYTGILGFIVADQFKDDSGKLLGVMLQAGSCKLGLSQDDWAKGRDRVRGAGVRVWCLTAQEVDQIAARIKANGGTVSDGPKDESWGARSLSIDDPDGYHLTIYREP